MSIIAGLSKGNLRTGMTSAGVLTTLVALALSSAALNAQNTGIEGVVKNAAGQPVTGALVKVRCDSLGLAFTTVSRAQGRYSTSHLLPGKYEVQSFGGTTQSPTAGLIEVVKGHQAKVDLVLSVPLQVPPKEKRLTDDDYAKLMPDSDPAEIKQITVSDCRECHTLQWTVSARKSREKWEQTVNRMYHDLLGRRMPLWFALKDDEFVGGKRFGLLMDYLTKNFGPQTPLEPGVFGPWVVAGSAPHPNRNLPTALLNGASAKYVAMEFSLPPDSMLSDIAVDSQGIAWVSEGNTGMLGRFEPNSLAYTRIPSPPSKNSKFQLDSVAVDPQDQVWLVDDGPDARILHYKAKAGGFDSYPIPEYRWPVPDVGGARIATLRFFNGNVWGTRLTAQRILKLDPGSRKVTEYPVPRGSSPFGLAVSGDNAVWYSAEVGNVVVKLNPSTGELTPHDVPTERSDLRGLSMDAAGNLWVAATESGKLVKLDGHSGKATEYTPPTPDSGPYSVDVDTKRNLVWFSEIFSDRIGRFDPSTNSFVEFPLPSADLDVRRIEIDRSHPNRVWWSGGHAGKIGYVEATE
jgi:streptogramin lyase